MANILTRLVGGTLARSEFVELVRIVRVSWSLLSASERLFFLVRIGIRFALNGLDLVAVALTGLLGAITATGLSGQGIKILNYQVPVPTAQNVITLVALVAGLFILRGALAILFERWTAIFLAGLEIKYSAKITRYLFSGSLQRLKKYSRAQIGWLVSNSVNATFTGVLGSVTTFILEGSLFISIFVMFLIVDWRSALAIAFYLFGTIWVSQRFTSQRYFESGRRLRDSGIGADSAILEMVDAYREIAVWGKQNFFLTRFIEAKKLGARTGVDLQILKSIPRFITESGLILGALGFVVWQLSRGTLAEGLVALGIFMAGSFRMMGAILPLQSTWNGLRTMQNWVQMGQEVLVTLRDTPEMLDEGIFRETKLLEADLTISIPDGALAIEVKDVAFTHLNSDEEALKSVSLSIPAGCYAAVVGPSGAGKTTLVDLLLGLYDPDSGTVSLAGIDPRIIREQAPGLISYVPQRPGLVTGTIAQNIALGVPDSDIDEDKVLLALQKAQLFDHVDSLPSGIHSSLGPQSDSLSGGQIQRLGFARALYTDPKLIILDEATSALDAATEATVAASIKNVGDETTVVVIAHRLSTIQDADTVFVMEEGRILAQGTFKQVRKAVPMIEEYVQLMSFRDD
jgi:ABC-type multidrug transport system fused ATPase/permease subunit